MQDEKLTVRYVTVQNCFVYLPDAWLRRVATKPNVMKLIHNNADFYVSWHSRPSPDDSLRLSATFARTLGIKEGDQVFVCCEAHSASVARVVVTPQSTQDWEIVELQNNKIQASLLDQINIVARNQRITVWVSKSLSVTLIVDSMEPNFKYGKLEELTELVVSPPKAESQYEHDSQSQNAESKVWNMLKNLMPTTLVGSVDARCGTASNNVENSAGKCLQNYRTNAIETFRVHPLPKVHHVDSMNTFDSLFQHPYHVFVHRGNLLGDFAKFKDSGNFFCRVTKVRENQQHVKMTNTNFLKADNASIPKEATELVAKVFVLEDTLVKCSTNVDKEHFAIDSLHKSVYLSESLRRNLRLRIGAKVILERTEFSEQNVSSIDIFPLKKDLTEEAFRNYIKEHSKYNQMLINSGAKLFFNDEVSCIVRISPEECRYAMLDEFRLRNIQTYVRDAVHTLENQMENSDALEEIHLGNVSVRGLRSIISECEVTLKLGLGLHRTRNLEYYRENIIICGKVGSGKTTFGQILRESFRKVPNFVHMHVIDCKPLKGKKVEMLHKVFLPAVLDCVYHQPSILFIDDLESIAGSSSNEEENTPDAINATRIADMLINIISEYQSSNYVAVVATCTNVNKISQKLVAPRGVHLFRTVLAIPDFEKDERVDILQLALKSKLIISDDVNWNYYGNKTEGWVAQDLVDFAEKAAFTAWKRHVKNAVKSNLTLFDEDLSHSLEKSTPMSLQGVHLYTGPGHTWSDIGGLADVKESLIELLHWPLKYPELFKNAPIRHQGGVLLYGAPGTGKTMLAGAISKECGLNFISVKGPELLSKYIGASEEAVRNIFDKAQSAKPCVLFFDEFDSLAPRRGHDSTGVTDRVVNQLLTQLDGVEGRQGVAVVAASSRPDLLDPALLRPGRLDKALLCPLPDQEDREEILVALCKSHGLDEDGIDLKALAAMSSGYTGADLNAALSQARLMALEESLAAASAEGKTEVGNITITQDQLLDSMRSTRPSLSAAEKAKYNRIYAKFTKGDNFSTDILQNQRATLA